MTKAERKTVEAFVREMELWTCGLCDSELGTIASDSCVVCKRRGKKHRALLKALGR